MRKTDVVFIVIDLRLNRSIVTTSCRLVVHVQANNIKCGNTFTELGIEIYIA